MILFSRALLTALKNKVTEWITEVTTQRKNNLVIDNVNRTITIYKTIVASTGNPHHMNFLPIVIDGYEAIMPDELLFTNGWWQCPNSWNNKGIREVSFDIVKENTTEVVATYTLLLNWDSTGEV